MPTRLETRRETRASRERIEGESTQERPVMKALESPVGAFLVLMMNRLRHLFLRLSMIARGQPRKRPLGRRSGKPRREARSRNEQRSLPARERSGHPYPMCRPPFLALRYRPRRDAAAVLHAADVIVVVVERMAVMTRNRCRKLPAIPSKVLE